MTRWSVTGKQTGRAARVADTCKHCRKPIARCEEFPAHAGCGSGYGWIHLEPNWGHSCQPRSGAPYARPAAARTSGQVTP